MLESQRMQLLLILRQTFSEKNYKTRITCTNKALFSFVLKLQLEGKACVSYIGGKYLCHPQENCRPQISFEVIKLHSPP